ncbi:MAG: DUF779 domain-containing protein [Methyloligellaceae bacterium]
MTQISEEMQVEATEEALQLIQQIKAVHGEALIFHQSGGCCDGSSPMCFPANEFPLGDNDVLIGDIGGVPFYIARDQHEKWSHTHLIIDVVNGMGGMFSLENGTGKRFLTKSNVCHMP